MSAESVALVGITSVTSILLAIVARIRCKCTPDQETGRCVVRSGCSDVPLDHRDDEELEVSMHELGGDRRVLLVTNKTT